MAKLDELQRLGLVVGRVVAVAEHVGARAPSHLVTLDLGPHGRREATVPAGGTPASELEGVQVACLLDGDDVHVLAAHSHAHGLVLLQPVREVTDGSPVA